MPSGENAPPVFDHDHEPLADRMAKLFDAIAAKGATHAVTFRPGPTMQMTVQETYHLDRVIEYCDRDDQPVMGCAMDTQSTWDPDKPYIWMQAIAQLNARMGAEVHLLVYCPDPAVADRYRELLRSDGTSPTLQPKIFTAHDVVTMLEECGKLTPEIRDGILNSTDSIQIDTWFRRATTGEPVSDQAQ